MCLAGIIKYRPRWCLFVTLNYIYPITLHRTTALGIIIMIQCAKICIGKRKYELIASKWCANWKAKNRDGNRTWVLTSIINREWKVMEKESKNSKRQQIKGQCKCETVCTNTVGCAIFFQVGFFFTAAGLVVWLFGVCLTAIFVKCWYALVWMRTKHISTNDLMTDAVILIYVTIDSVAAAV